MIVLRSENDGKILEILENLPQARDDEVVAE
jgi:hypothetical protein